MRLAKSRLRRLLACTRLRAQPSTRLRLAQDDGYFSLCVFTWGCGEYAMDAIGRDKTHPYKKTPVGIHRGSIGNDNLFAASANAGFGPLGFLQQASVRIRRKCNCSCFFYIALCIKTDFAGLFSIRQKEITSVTSQRSVFQFSATPWASFFHSAPSCSGYC